MSQNTKCGVGHMATGEGGVAMPVHPISSAQTVGPSSSNLKPGQQQATNSVSCLSSKQHVLQTPPLGNPACYKLPQPSALLSCLLDFRLVPSA